MCSRQHPPGQFCSAASALLSVILLSMNTVSSIAQDENQAKGNGQQTVQPKAKRPGELPDGIAFVPEMAAVQELRYVRAGKWWSKEDEGDLSDEIAHARAAWKEESEMLKPLLTATRVRSLSRWAKVQMQRYETVPAVTDVHLKPIGLLDARGKIVLEGTIDTLPSHHHLVTRWLKVYVLYNISERKIAHVTFTIRGQRLE